jgi:surface carbohydrate biosynthesis protein
VRVGFIVDHPRREISGAAMLAYELARRGHETVIVPFYYQSIDVPLLGLDAIVVNYVRANNADLLRAYHDLGIRIFVLDTEGGILTEKGMNAPDRWARSIRATGLTDLLEGYFFWGSHVADVFAAEGVLPRDRIHVTGCPRFDVCAPQWRSILKFRQSGYILVNTNFPTINPRFSQSIEHERKVMHGAGWDAGYVEELFAQQVDVFERYKAALLAFARQKPNSQILVRPHPFENQQIYRDLFKDTPNVMVSGEGSSLNVINQSSCVLHLNCGTSVEAIMLGKVPINLEFLNTELLRSHGRLPWQISYLAHTPAELGASVDNIEAIGASFNFDELYDKYILPWFHKGDGNAGARIADVLSGFGGKGTKVSSRVSRSARPSQRLQALLFNATGSRFGSALREMVQPGRRDKSISIPMLRFFLDAYSVVEQGRVGYDVGHARHPLHGFPLTSICVRPST